MILTIKYTLRLPHHIYNDDDFVNRSYEKSIVLARKSHINIKNKKGWERHAFFVTAPILIHQVCKLTQTEVGPTAVDNDGRLDKEATSYNDIFDA